MPTMMLKNASASHLVRRRHGSPRRRVQRLLLRTQTTRGLEDLWAPGWIIQVGFPPKKREILASS